MSEARAFEPATGRTRTVTVIPARIRALPGMPTLAIQKKRVAAYARVSTNSEEQLTSYEAQVKHYTEYIQSKEHTDHWQFVDVYTDRGITGTSTAKREGFNRMIQDALAGKIDLIITKSVSRFARNTVDTLTTIRKLKEHGVEVYFEEQNIYTMDGKGEVLLTIMSSIAQEESRNISENVTWGMRKRFAEGKVTMAYKQFMGYRRGKNGIPEVVEAEAKIIRTIFRRFLEGATPAIIARELNLAGIPCPSRKSLLGEDEIEAAKARKKTARWSPSTIESILTNEKYKGDALLQKTITVDFLSKAHKINEGEAPQFFVENSHPAIISREVYDLVQMELQRRGKRGRRTSAKSIFSDRLICGECGATFGSKVWHSTDPYRKVIWRCNQKYTRKDEKCPNRHLNEEKIKEAFVIAVNQLVIQRDEILTTYDRIFAGLTDTAALEADLQRLELEKDGILQRITDLIHENATTKMDQGEYNRRYDALEAQRVAISEKQKRIKEKLSDKLFRKRKLEAFMSELKNAERLIDFDEQLFIRTVEQITVFPDKLAFVFRDGTEIPVEE